MVISKPPKCLTEGKGQHILDGIVNAYHWMNMGFSEKSFLYKRPVWWRKLEKGYKFTGTKITNGKLKARNNGR